MLEHSMLALQKGNKEEGMHSSGGHLLCYCFFNLSFQVKEHTLPIFRLEHLDLFILFRQPLTHKPEGCVSELIDDSGQLDTV